MKKKYGLLGYPLGHSFSKKYFDRFFANEHLEGFTFENFAIKDIEEAAEKLFAYPDLGGFTVTIPHKRAIMPFLDELSPEAREIGAVNCVKIMPDGKRVGYNTDTYGFEVSLTSMLHGKRPGALVLGTGGASKAVCYTLRKMGIDYRLVSRNAGEGMITYDDITPGMVSEALIINTTPLGMYPNTDASPRIPYKHIAEKAFLYDLVYNPADTEFTKQGRVKHATVKSGYEMLVEQAKKAWNIWME